MTGEDLRDIRKYSIKRILIWSVVAIIALFLLSWTLGKLTAPAQIQPKLSDIPVYPNAYAVQSSSESITRETYDYGPLLISGRRLTFFTHDDRDAVTRFYDNALAKTGWQMGAIGPPGGASLNNPLSYFWPTAEKARVNLTISVEDDFSINSDPIGVTIIAEQEPDSYPSPISHPTLPPPLPTQVK